MKAVCTLQRAEPWTRMIAAEGSSADVTVAREVKWHTDSIRQSCRAQDMSGDV